MTGAPGGGGGLQASPAGAGPSADPARRGLPRAQETLVTWPELMSPGRALEGLRVELAARGLATVGMTVTRLQGMLTLAEGPGVGYCCGWLFWPAGRLSRGGRPLYAVHRARDPAGAARRLAPARAPGRQRGATAREPATVTACHPEAHDSYRDARPAPGDKKRTHPA